MFPRIKAVTYVQDYRLMLTFSNGEQGEIDLYDRVVGRGGVFLPLEDLAVFKTVTIEPESGTLVWPNGVDLDPDVLYCKTMRIPLPQLELA